MPTYDYRCPMCGAHRSMLRRVMDRNHPLRCTCGYFLERLIMAPAMHIWNTERKFPNVSPRGDGTLSFESKSAYEAHLKAVGLREVSHDGKIERPHDNKVIRKFK